MPHLKDLEVLNCTPDEARVYLAALELGEASASVVAKRARMTSSRVEVILPALVRQKFCIARMKSGVRLYTARDPKLLCDEESERLQRLRTRIPELRLLMPAKDGDRPRVQYYEGYDGLTDAMDDTLVVPDKTILAWADIDLAWEVLGDYYPQYIRRKNERNIFVRGIFVKDRIGERFKERARIERREVKLIVREQFPVSNEINIYDDKVLIVSHRDLLAVIIQDREIADTQRAIFELAWSLLEGKGPTAS